MEENELEQTTVPEELPVKPRYFWHLPEGSSLPKLSLLFILLSITDLIATVRMMAAAGVKEGNPIADGILKNFGIPGFVGFKLFMVFFALALIWYINEHRPKLATLVLWAATLLMGFITLVHLSLMSGILAVQPTLGGG
ncbi:MAG: DUF5658 family protein [bacterium]